MTGSRSFASAEPGRAERNAGKIKVQRITGTATGRRDFKGPRKERMAGAFDITTPRELLARGQTTITLKKGGLADG